MKPARAAEALCRAAATALLETRLNLGSPAPWVVGGILAAFGYLTVRTAPEASSFPLSWALSLELGALSAVLLLFLAASLAHRPQRYDVTELLESKMAGSAELILGRWLGMTAAVAAAMGVGYAAVMAAQAYHSSFPVVPRLYALSALRVLPPVLFLATLGFFLVTVLRSLVLGAGLAGLLWFALYFGQTYLPTALRLDLSQNGRLFLALAGASVLAMLAGYGCARRARASRATSLLAGAALLTLAGAVLHAAWLTLALPGRGKAAAAWERLESRRRPAGEPLPNFAWTDDRGRRVSLASMRGGPVLLLFYQPRDSGLLPLLRRAAALRERVAARGGAVLPVCLSEDLNAGGQALAAAGVEMPGVTDWGGPAAGAFDRRRPASVLAWRLAIERTPAALLLDGAGRAAERDLPTDAAGWEELVKRVDRALEAAP